MRSSTFQRTVAFFLVGNAVAALAPWLIFWGISRTMGLDDAGAYAIALTITTPVFLVLTSGLRLRQLTRGGGVDELPQETLARAMSGVVALGISVTVFLIAFSRDSPLAILVAVGTWKLIDAVADAPYTQYQAVRTGRRYLRSSVPRSAVAVVVALVGLAALDFGPALSLFLGAAFSLVLLTGFDLRRIALVSGAREVRNASRLVLQAFPLGVTAMLVSLGLYGPRLVLAISEGERPSARFAALSVIFVAVSFVTAVAGQTAIPALSRAAAARDGARFFGLLARLLAVSGLMGTVVFGAVAVVGSRPLTWALGHEYDELGGPLLVLSIALALSCLVTFVQDALTSLRVFRLQIVLFGLGAFAGVIAALVMVPNLGINGAAWAVVCAIGAQLAGCSATLALVAQRHFSRARVAPRSGLSRAMGKPQH